MLHPPNPPPPTHTHDTKYNYNCCTTEVYVIFNYTNFQNKVCCQNTRIYDYFKMISESEIKLVFVCYLNI